MILYPDELLVGEVIVAEVAALMQLNQRQV